MSDMTAERAAFEAWAQRYTCPIPAAGVAMTRGIQQMAWDAWQAARAFPLAAAEPVAIKGHTVREFVNDLTEIARLFHAAGQLRERVSGRVQQFLEPLRAAPDRAPSTDSATEEQDALAKIVRALQPNPAVEALKAKYDSATERDAGWVAVADRLPEFDVPVWLFEQGRNIWIGARGFDNEGWLWGNCYGAAYSRPDGTWDSDTNDCDDDYKPTHWMPLPAGPAIAAMKGEA